MHERLEQRRAGEMVGVLREALADGEPAARVWELMAALEDATGVLAFLAGDFEAAPRTRSDLAAQASALVVLAGLLEQAADRADL